MAPTTTTDVPMRGQMDVYDCIDVAERESEGKLMATLIRAKPELTESQRMAVQTRVRQMREGRVRIPPACPSCYSPSLQTERANAGESGVRCLTCGRSTDETTVATVRKQRIRRFLLDGKGVDIR